LEPGSERRAGVQLRLRGPRTAVIYIGPMLMPMVASLSVVDPANLVARLRDSQ
jgi:hypothetical protein